MDAENNFLKGKRGLIMGVANDRSIAWGLAAAAAESGAELAFTYQGEALEKRVRPLAEKIGANIVVPCDVTDEASVDAAFKAIEDEWGQLDFVVHAIAFSDKNELDGQYLDTTRENFTRTMDISVVFLHSCGAARCAADEGGRFFADADLLRRGAGDAAFITSWVWPKRRLRLLCVIWRRIWVRRISV